MKLTSLRYWFTLNGGQMDTMLQMSSDIKDLQKRASIKRNRVVETSAFLMKQGFQIKEYRTTWILLKAEEEQENNGGHSLYRPTLLLQLSLSASSYTSGLSQMTALSCILWFLTMTLSFSKLFHWRLVFNCLISTLCIPTLSYTTGSPSTSTFVLFSVNCDSWLWLKAQVD